MMICSILAANSAFLCKKWLYYVIIHSLKLSLSIIFNPSYTQKLVKSTEVFCYLCFPNAKAAKSLSLFMNQTIAADQRKCNLYLKCRSKQQPFTAGFEAKHDVGHKDQSGFSISMFWWAQVKLLHHLILMASYLFKLLLAFNEGQQLAAGAGLSMCTGTHGPPLELAQRGFICSAPIQPTWLSCQPN